MPADPTVVKATGKWSDAATRTSPALVSDPGSVSEAGAAAPQEPGPGGGGG